ncbi:MAG TPA: hypothetical protein VFG99_05995, partial [Chloroflexia bacterium]|nr:hypothetical protein [Chloroflexia bacterium]
MRKLRPDELLAELARRRALERADAFPPELVASLHPKQQAFVRDPAKRKAALCSRRAGKSYGAAAFLLEGGYSDPGGLSVYVVGSKGLARKIMLPAMESFNRQYNLGLHVREVDGQLEVKLKNGHQIWLAGVKDSAAIEKFRGPKYRRVVIDEAQRYGAYLEEMIQDVFEPALLDKGGELVLSGTPSPVPAGLFYSATTGDGGPIWSVHHWTILDNPFVTGTVEWLEQYCRQYGMSHEHPTYQREWLGRWVRDIGALVAPFDSNLNGFRVDDMPPGPYDYAVVVDLGAGAQASTAFVVMAQRRGHPETYVLQAEKKADMIPSKIAAYAEMLCRSLPTWPQLVVDEGGLGKGYADEMRKTYGLNAVAAEKKKKRTFLELFGGDLRNGTIKVDPYNCRDLVDEMHLCQWLPDR